MSSLQNPTSANAIAPTTTASIDIASDLDPLACEFLCQKMQQWAGVEISPTKTYLIRSRMRPLLVKEGVDNLRQLIERASQPSGLQLREQVVDAMTTHETMFFRDAHPFESLVQQVLPELLKNRKTRERVRIHCAACSTGQEPYSIAMRILESLPQAASQVEITASDISTGCIKTARMGVYLQHELRRGVSEQQRNRFFSSVQGSSTAGPSWQLIPEVRHQVRFEVESLTDARPSLLQPNSIDVLLCRNVLIYFDAPTRAGIVTRLADALKPNSLFLLGSAEMLRDCKDRFVGEKIGVTQWQRKLR